MLTAILVVALATPATQPASRPASQPTSRPVTTQPASRPATSSRTLTPAERKRILEINRRTSELRRQLSDEAKQELAALSSELRSIHSRAWRPADRAASGGGFRDALALGDVGMITGTLVRAMGPDKALIRSRVPFSDARIKRGEPNIAASGVRMYATEYDLILVGVDTTGAVTGSTVAPPVPMRITGTENVPTQGGGTKTIFVLSPAE